jgi:hypothetical protein
VCVRIRIGVHRNGTPPPPARNVIKINVDGAFNPSTGAVAIGVIARNHEGNPHVMVWRLLFHCRDAEEVEALAAWEGLCFAGRCFPSGN